MRAVAIGRSVSDRDRPALLDVPDPEPGDGQVRVLVLSAAVNRIDLLWADGSTPPPRDRFGVLGVEFSGLVESLGSGVSRWKVGDRVCGLSRSGAHAELVCADEGDLLRFPESWTDAEGAAFPEAFATAWFALFRREQCGIDGAVLVHGGASSVGLALAKLGSLHGISVIAACSTPLKADAARSAGASDAIVHLEEDIMSGVQRRTSSRGVSMVVDNLGAGRMKDNLAVLADGGELVSIGSEEGSEAVVPLREVRSRRLTISGFSVTRLPKSERQRIFAALAEVISEDGSEAGSRSLVPLVHREFALEDAARAYEAQGTRTRIGKVILVPSR